MSNPQLERHERLADRTVQLAIFHGPLRKGERLEQAEVKIVDEWRRVELDTPTRESGDE